ncbi:MAG: multidrug transporter MatE [Bacillota bacterium]|nr:multidrug transporter MatE [Bacillota bacterium]
MISMFGNAYLHSGAVHENILNQALGYLSWMRFTILIMPIQMLIGAAVYYDGDETISNIASIVQGVGNIVFSIVFSRFMGIRGIGLASFLFYSISLAIFLLHFMAKKNSLRMNLFFSFDLLKDVIRYSIIDSSSYLFLAAFTAILNSYVTTRYGSAYIIIVSAVTLSREFQLLFEGIGEAVGPIFSVYVGEHSHEGLRTINRLAYKTAIMEGILVTIVLFFLASFAPQVLNVTEPALERWIVEGVRMTALGSAFVSILYLLTSYYLVIEQILLGLIACAFRDVIFSISLVLVMGGIWGIFGMFLGLVAAPAVAYAVLLIGIRMYYGREDCPLLLSKIPGGENSYLFHLRTEPEDIIRAQKQIEDLLTEHRTDRKTVQRVALLIEEMYLLIRKMNGDKAVLSECTVILKPEGVQIISKDEGVAFDMGSEDVSTVSMSAYIIAAYLEKREFDHRHLMTMSYNRCSLFIPYAAETV